MKYRLLYGLAGLFLGYLVGAVGGWLLIVLLSSNSYDKSLEAVMTAFFVAGPLGALIGTMLGVIYGKR